MRIWRHQDFYLSPLPLTGATAEAMDAWVTEGVRQGKMGELERIVRTNDRGHTVLAAEGYEFERTCEAPGAAGDAAAWHERVLMVRSHACRATGHWVGKTSVPCGDQTGNPDAPERAGQTANH